VKLSALTEEVVNHAVSIYQDLAYGSVVPRKRFGVTKDQELGGVLGRFQKDQIEPVTGYACSRYTMRLGNRNYPFMKLVLQEHLLAGEFFFTVDTHDQMEIGSDFPDYEQWVAVRSFNAELKRRIEDSFEHAGLDTSAVVRRMIVESSGEPGKPCRGLVLIVDDEEDLAAAVEVLIRRSGFRTCKVHDGKSGVAATRELMPDLLLLDYELPELDGLQVIDQLRADASTREIPILLNSAARMTMSDIQKADGFLSKPFPESLLNEMITRVISKRCDRVTEQPQPSTERDVSGKAAKNGGSTS
jgi:two-component system, OmpR family, phosphate regulon response regulator PhoB